MARLTISKGGKTTVEITASDGSTKDSRPKPSPKPKRVRGGRSQKNLNNLIEDLKEVHGRDWGEKSGLPLYMEDETRRVMFNYLRRYGNTREHEVAVQKDRRDLECYYEEECRPGRFNCHMMGGDSSNCWQTQAGKKVIVNGIIFEVISKEEFLSQ